jgi:hypothetical protein
MPIILLGDFTIFTIHLRDLEIGVLENLWKVSEHRGLLG